MGNNIFILAAFFLYLIIMIVRSHGISESVPFNDFLLKVE